MFIIFDSCHFFHLALEESSVSVAKGGVPVTSFIWVTASDLLLCKNISNDSKINDLQIKKKKIDTIVHADV